MNDIYQLKVDFEMLLHEFNFMIEQSTKLRKELLKNDPNIKTKK